MENENLPFYYTILFNGVTDAIDTLDRGDACRAREILVQSQQRAEAAYLEAPPPGGG